MKLRSRTESIISCRKREQGKGMRERGKQHQQREDQRERKRRPQVKDRQTKTGISQSHKL